MVTRKTRSTRRTIRKAPRTARSRRTTAKTTRRRVPRGRSTTGRSLTDLTREQLYRTAKRMKIAGRSHMTKGQLIRAIRRAS